MAAAEDRGDRPEPVILAAPFGRDADILAETVDQLGAAVTRLRAPGPADLTAALEDGLSAFIATEEALSPPILETLADFLSREPAWSNPPVLLLVEDEGVGAEAIERLRDARAGSHVSLLLRPVTALELRSAVSIALAARKAQFEVSGLLDAHKQAEERANFWLREANHRVKNILATVVAIARMSSRPGQTTQTAFGDFQARLSSLAAIHGLYEDASAQGVPFETLAWAVFKPYDLKSRDWMQITSPSLLIKREAANALALCLHELVTNAVKYGALSVDNGGVDLRLARETEDGRATLSWIERGGPPVEAPSRAGYGTKFLQTSLESLFGTAPVLEYGPHGFRLSVTGDASALFDD